MAIAFRFIMIQMSFIVIVTLCFSSLYFLGTFSHLPSKIHALSVLFVFYLRYSNGSYFIWFIFKNYSSMESTF